MCLIVFNFTPGQPRHLLLAANRDEFHDRPARPLAWWSWPSGLLAGRDEVAGGTWLAVTRDGRWSAVTNYRDPRARPGSRSRGELPLAYLQARTLPGDYVSAVYQRHDDYGPFNLLAGDHDQLWYCSSATPATAVAAGVHALSNGALDEPWPKSRLLSKGMRELIGQPGQPDQTEQERLFALMDDRRPAPDSELPDTGVGLDRERALSPPFIVSPSYGTRCTTIVSLGRESRVSERRFSPNGEVCGDLRYRFDSSRH